MLGVELKNGEKIEKISELSKVSSYLLWITIPLFIVCSLLSFALGILFFITIPVMIACVVLLFIALYQTANNKKNIIAVTNMRVVARSGRQELIFPVEAFVNANVEISLLGRIFGYGTINMQTRKGSISVSCICDPVAWKSYLYSLLEKDYL